MAMKMLNRTNIFKKGIRCFSSETKLISVSVNDKTGVATLELQRPPVNSLNLELLSEISASLTDLEKNKARGLILTSKKDGVFCAGLDILEMYKPEPERLKLFWTALQDTWIKLYGTSFPSVALINGHSPAGGCLLALSCEYRVMYKNFTIGLNETQLGIVAPPWFINSMKNVIGQRQSEKALTCGQMFSTDEALKIGLIDEVADNKEDAVAKSDAFIGRFAKIPPLARKLTKNSLRDKTIENLVKNRQEDLNQFVTFAQQPIVQAGLGLYIENLKKKSAKV